MPMVQASQKPVPVNSGTRNARRTPSGFGFVRRRQSGVIAIMLALLLPVIIGFVAFALELGRIYNRKVEMHAVANNVALTAASKLDGTSQGVTNALAAAHEVVESGDNKTTKPRYGYVNTMVFSDEAIRFASSSDGGSGWLSASEAKLSPAGIGYVKVDTNDLNADYGTVNLLFMRIFGQTSAKVSYTAVAGRPRLKLMPLALCSMAKDAANPITPRNNPGGYSELIEFGFRRGVSYNLLKLSPNSSTAVNYVVDPISLPPKSGSFAAGTVGPYVCTGTVELPRVIDKTLNLQSGFPINAMLPQLNSRFNVFTGVGKCSATAAPPDSNIKAFTPGSITWMTAPAGQVPDQAPTTNRMETIADLDPLGTFNATRYGPLWVYARPVPWTAYAPGQSEPAGGYTPFAASKDVWDNLYTTGANLKTYPTDPKTGAQLPPYSVPVPEPSTNFPGVRNRRVLNVPLVDCSGGGSPGKVLAIGRFFMTVPADVNGIYAEFAGALLHEEITGPVELYR
jgi:hypothetical protein